MKNLIEALQEKFGKEVFTEDVQKDFEVKLEIAIQEKVQEKVQEKEKELEEAAVVELEEFKNTLVEKIDEYVNYATEEFFSKNEIAIVNETKVEMANKVIESIKDVLSNYGIEIEPEDLKTIDTLKEEISTLKNNINKKIHENIEIKSALEEKEQDLKFVEMTKDLSESEKDKVKNLFEGLNFSGIEDYQRKLAICIEKISKTNKFLESKKTDDLDTNINEGTQKIHPSLNKKISL